MRYRLRTLLIVLALGPPVLAWLLFQSAVMTARYREHGRLNWRTVGGDVAGVKRLFTGEPAPSLDPDYEAIQRKFDEANAAGRKLRDSN